MDAQHRSSEEKVVTDADVKKEAINWEFPDDPRETSESATEILSKERINQIVADQAMKHVSMGESNRQHIINSDIKQELKLATDSDLMKRKEQSCDLILQQVPTDIRTESTHLFKTEHLDLDDAQILADEIREMILKKREERSSFNSIMVTEDTNAVTDTEDVAGNTSRKITNSGIRAELCRWAESEKLNEQVASWRGTLHRLPTDTVPPSTTTSDMNRVIMEVDPLEHYAECADDIDSEKECGQVNNKEDAQDIKYINIQDYLELGETVVNQSNRAAPDVLTAPGLIKEEHPDPDDAQMFADEETIKELILNETEVRHGTTSTNTEEEIIADTRIIAKTDDVGSIGILTNEFWEESFRSSEMEMLKEQLASWRVILHRLPTDALPPSTTTSESTRLFTTEHLDMDDAQILADEIREMILKKREERSSFNSIMVTEDTNAVYDGSEYVPRPLKLDPHFDNEGSGLETQTINKVEGITLNTIDEEQKNTQDYLDIGETVVNRAAPGVPSALDGDIKINIDANCIQEKESNEMHQLRTEDSSNKITKIAATYSILKHQTVTKKRAILQNKKKINFTEIITTTDFPIKNVVSNFRYEPNKCHTSDLNITQSYVLKRHQRTHTTEEKRFECDACSYGTSFKYRMKDHMLRHTGDKPFHCDTCNDTCIQSSNLKPHKRKHTGNKPFQCDICNHSSYNNCDLKRHQRTHTGDKPFQCDTCNYTCNSNSNLKRHKRTHTGDKPYQCDTCSYTCSQSNSLKSHKRTHTGDKPFQCDTCIYSCKSSGDLKNHKRIHTGDKPFQCDTCNYTCSHRNSLKIHKRTHTGVKPFQCDTCNYTCSQSSSLKAHKRTHTGDKPFQCDTCNYTCSQSSSLKVHKRSHTGYKSLHCDTCNYSSNSISNLKTHKRIHTGDKPFQCDTCNYTCSQSSSLKVHKRTHTRNKPFQCDICNYSSYNNCDLKRHQRTHTGDKPFQCDTCNYTCNSNSNLKRHKRTHTGDKPYQCDTCSYTCSQSHSLKSHKRTHTGDKPFQCDTCIYSCKSSGDLKTHKRIHTGGKPFQCDTCNYTCSHRNILKIHKLNIHGRKAV